MDATQQPPTRQPFLTRSPVEIRQLFFQLDSPQDVADLLELRHGYLTYVMYRGRARYPYRLFEIPKKAGGVRAISAPHPTVGLIQSKLNEVLQLVYSPRPTVHGFVRGGSILTNALLHAGKRLVLNVDLADFFPSINFGRVRGMFMGQPYGRNDAVATVLAQLVCNENAIPQGAPTSPMVSNMICGRMDSELRRLAAENGCIYTRYADDLTFSTRKPRISPQIAIDAAEAPSGEVMLGTALRDVIESNGFRVNEAKVRLQPRNQRQSVTGLTVNKFPNVKRTYVRHLRAMLHDLDDRGEEEAERKFFSRSDHRRTHNPELTSRSFRHVIRGKLDFLSMVRGESDPVYRRLRDRFHELLPDAIDPCPPLEVTGATGSSGPDRAWTYWFERYKHLVFYVVLQQASGDSYSATCFLYRRDVLATAAHVLDHPASVCPPFPDETPVTGFALHANSKVDAALIPFVQTGIRGERFPIRTDKLQIGEPVAALGFPRVPDTEPRLAIREGHVNLVSTNYAGTIDRVMVSIPIAGGMSGGPVIDRGGNLVGVVIEKAWEQVATEQGVPATPLPQVLPIHYLRDIQL